MANTSIEKDQFVSVIMQQFDLLYARAEAAEKRIAELEATEAKVAKEIALIERELAEPPTDISTEFANKVLDALK